MTTIIRKKQRDTILDLSSGDRYELLRDYKKNTELGALSKKYNVSKAGIKHFIHKEYTEFLVSKETHNLYSSKNEFDNLRRPKDINDGFMELIENGAGLAYAYYFAMTNDNRTALRESGLTHGIVKVDKAETNVVKNAYKLRGLYLRSIPAIQKEIQKVREDALASSPISKTYIQSELCTQIEELKEIVHDDSGLRGTITKNIELLGRSIGAFSDRIEVTDISPNDALDKLIDMAKVSSTYSVEGE